MAESVRPYVVVTATDAPVESEPLTVVAAPAPASDPAALAAVESAQIATSLTAPVDKQLAAAQNVIATETNGTGLMSVATILVAAMLLAVRAIKDLLGFFGKSKPKLRSKNDSSS